MYNLIPLLCALVFFVVTMVLNLELEHHLLLGEWYFETNKEIYEWFHNLASQAMAHIAEQWRTREIYFSRGWLLLVLANFCLCSWSIVILDVQPFTGLHLCVLFVPILFFLFCVISLILLSFQFLRANKVSPIVFKDFLKSWFVFGKVRWCERFVWFCLLLQLLNPVNWSYVIPLFGGLLLASPSVSGIVCSVLFCTGVLLTLYRYQFSSHQTLAMIQIPFLICFGVFFLLLLAYTCDFLIVFMALEGLTLSVCVMLVLGGDSFETVSVLVKKELSIRVSLASLNLSSLLESFKLLHLLPQYAQQLASSSALTYFLLNIIVTVSFGFVLFLSAFFFDTLNLNAISNFLAGSSGKESFILPIFVLTFLLFIVFSFKLGVAPFHFWVPAVFSGASFPVLFFLSVPLKLVFLVLMHKIFYGVFYNYIYIWKFYFLFAGLLSIIIGSVGLYLHKDIRKFLAYSTINHFGYIFLAFGCGTVLGQQAFFIYSLTYFLTTMPFFLFVGNLRNEQTRLPITSLTELTDHLSGARYLHFFFGFILLSMLGLPPLLGFWGKFSVLMAILADPSLLSSCIAILVILTSLVAASSYLGIFKNLFISSSRPVPFTAFSVFDIRVLLLSCFFFVMLLFGWTSYFCPSLFRFFIYFIYNNHFDFTFYDFSLGYSKGTIDLMLLLGADLGDIWVAVDLAELMYFYAFEVDGYVDCLNGSAVQTVLDSNESASSVVEIYLFVYDANAQHCVAYPPVDTHSYILSGCDVPYPAMDPSLQAFWEMYVRHARSCGVKENFIAVYPWDEIDVALEECYNANLQLLQCCFDLSPDDRGWKTLAQLLSYDGDFLQLKHSPEVLFNLSFVQFELLATLVELDPLFFFLPSDFFDSDFGFLFSQAWDIFKA